MGQQARQWQEIAPTCEKEKRLIPSISSVEMLRLRGITAFVTFSTVPPRGWEMARDETQGDLFTMPSKKTPLL